MNMRNAEQNDFRVSLASSSPQRHQVLNELGIPFRYVDPGITEVTLPSAEETVVANAKLKVLGAAKSCAEGNAILGADTVLCVNGKVHGKPASTEEAIRYLMELSGGNAVAWSGVATFSSDTRRGVVLVERAEIKFRAFSPEVVKWYLGTGEPLTRAGALGVSLLGEVFVESILGAHSCVVGLPKRSTLLACSDTIALGSRRMELSEDVCSMLRWQWIVSTRYFEETGKWL